MGGDTVVAGQVFGGGLSYTNIETLRVELGGGTNHFTIEGTSDASTTVVGGAGADTVDVKTIGGHTTVSTGAGNDVVNVDTGDHLVQLGGLLTIDTGTGLSDTVNVDDSARTGPSAITLTDTTIGGIPVPVVAEQQTIFVKALSGTYALDVPGFGTVTLDFADSALDVAAKLALVYGFDDFTVSEARTGRDVTYTVTFTRLRAGQNFGQLSWVGLWTLAAPAAATLTDPDYGTATLGATPDAAEVQAALRAIYQRERDHGHCRRRRHLRGAVLTGSRAGTPLAVAGTGVSVTAVTQLVARPDSSTDVRTATLHDGTTTPDRDNVQVIDVSATGGGYTLHFVLTSPTGELQDVHTGRIAFDASEADLLSALSAVLNRNNVNPALPFTDNVGVQKHGTSYTITFRGAMRDRKIEYVDLSQLTGGTATISTRLAGIDYYGVDTLNIAIGDGDHVLNIQGAGAGSTNIDTGAGDDRIYVGSGANVPVGGSAGFVTGTLAALEGAVNVSPARACTRSSSATKRRRRASRTA